MDTITKLLLAFTAILTLMIGAVIYVVIFASADPIEAVPESPPEDGVVPCDASSLEGSLCPDGLYCRFDTCVPAEAPETCAEGESCRDCECGAGLVCHHFRCIDSERVDKTPLVCIENTRLFDAVGQLVSKCKERKKDVNTIISSGSCSTKDWEELALEDDKFDLLLSAFPHRFAVHFQTGKPPLRSRDWPPSKIQDHYLAQIRSFREPLLSAKQIFVIGRASPDGSIKTNHDLALRRMNLVSQFIERVIYEGLTESQRDAYRIPIRSFTLPSAAPIQPDRYRSTYLQNPEGTEPLALDPLMTWDDPSLVALKRALDDPTLLNQRSGREWQELYGMVNRVVLVIPIPCLGTEYRPTVTDLVPTREVAG